MDRLKCQLDACIPLPGWFSGDHMNASPPLPSQNLQPLRYSWERSAGNMVIHQALTSGSGTWQSTEDKPWRSSTASRPHRRRAGPAVCSPIIVSPSSSFVRPPLPLLSLCRPPPLALAPYTAPDRRGPEWLTATGMLMSSSLQHSVCWSGSLSCPSLSKDAVVATAAGSPNLLHWSWGSGLAFRAHQLINRAGVGYSHLVLPRTGS